MRTLRWQALADGGFTLIEMLVSLALLALITATLAQMVFSARRALSYVDRASSQAPVYAAQSYVRSALEQAAPVEPQAVGDQSRLGFSGDADRVTFTTSHAPLGVYQGLYRVGLGAEPNDRGGYDLVAELELYRPTAAQAETAPRRTAKLLSGVASVTFSYFQPNVQEGESHWRADWSQSGSLPSLVSLDVRFPRGDSRQWETLTVPLGGAITSAVACPPRVNCD
ncbi:MAG: prepilin-type N-terminal cleavage/methylation domain-containing protein [Hyphomicrobium sp.]|jgi:prepilin-type N-terminal cleavage/methylation domain-containing protein